MDLVGNLDGSTGFQPVKKPKAWTADNVIELRTESPVYNLAQGQRSAALGLVPLT